MARTTSLTVPPQAWRMARTSAKEHSFQACFLSPEKGLLKGARGAGGGGGGEGRRGEGLRGWGRRRRVGGDVQHYHHQLDAGDAVDEAVVDLGDEGGAVA